MLVLILVVVAGILIIGAIQPTDIVVHRSTVINASKEATFEQIVNFKNWPRWSPWVEMEPTVVITYSGTDGQQGSAYHWEGNKTGSGDMINNSIEGTKMNYQLNFIKPFKSSAAGFFDVKDTAGMSKVTWSITTHTPFPMNAMHMFMDMDKMLGGDFEKGLSNMKRYIEANNAPPAPPVAIKEVDFAAHTYAGIRSTVSMMDMDKVWKENGPMLGKELGAKISGPSTGLYYTWDTVNKNTDMAVAFPVADTTKKVKGMTYMQVPQSKALMATMNGGYSGEMVVHKQISKRLAETGKQMAMVVEEYVNGPAQGMDSTKWVTNIYYIIK